MKKKSSFNYDLGFFFLVAVIAVSLSAFVREMNIVLSDVSDSNNLAAQALLSTATAPLFADDVAALKACFYQAVVQKPECAKADLNGDGYVNLSDKVVLGNSFKFDLNNDGVLTFANDLFDLAVMKDCFLEPVGTKQMCARADLDNDGYVNFSDLAKFKLAFNYDLNDDHRVGGVATNGDLVVLKNCFLIPLASSTPNCAKADLNGDKEVNFKDLSLFQIATNNTDYDIDQNGTVEIIPTTGSDLTRFKACLFEDPKTNTSCVRADFNADGNINFTDLALLKSATLYDLNGDGKVSFGSSTTSSSSLIKYLSLENTSSQTALGFYFSWQTTTPVNAKATFTCVPTVQLYNKEGNTTETCGVNSPVVLDYAPKGMQDHNAASYGPVGVTTPVLVTVTLDASYKPKEAALITDKRTMSVNLTKQSEGSSGTIANLISISSPASGSTVSNLVPFAVTVNPGNLVSISGVRLYVDGAIMTTDTSAPYVTTIDTNKYQNGNHVLTATAVDLNGNPLGYATANMLVNNASSGSLPISTPTVDLKINNSDGPITVNVPSVITAKWTASNVISCVRTAKAGGPVGWDANNIPFNGTFSYNLNYGGQPLSPSEKYVEYFAIQCVGTNGQTISDTVVINPVPTPTAPSRPSGK